MDKYDVAILRALQKDARASLNEVSEAVGLSSTPCWNRIRRMEADGVILGYTVRIDPTKIGLPDTVIVQVTLESHNDEMLYEFGQVLDEIPEILEAFLVSGTYDYYIRLVVRERLYKIPGIRHSISSFVLRVLKQAALPLPEGGGLIQKNNDALRIRRSKETVRRDERPGARIPRPRPRVRVCRRRDWGSSWRPSLSLTDGRKWGREFHWLRKFSAGNLARTSTILA